MAPTTSVVGATRGLRAESAGRVAFRATRGGACNASQQMWFWDIFVMIDLGHLRQIWSWDIMSTRSFSGILGQTFMHGLIFN